MEKCTKYQFEIDGLVCSGEKYSGHYAIRWPSQAPLKTFIYAIKPFLEETQLFYPEFNETGDEFECGVIYRDSGDKEFTHMPAVKASDLQSIPTNKTQFFRVNQLGLADFFWTSSEEDPHIGVISGYRKSAIISDLMNRTGQPAPESDKAFGKLGEEFKQYPKVLNEFGMGFGYVRSVSDTHYEISIKFPDGWRRSRVPKKSSSESMQPHTIIRRLFVEDGDGVHGPKISEVRHLESPAKGFKPNHFDRPYAHYEADSITSEVVAKWMEKNKLSSQYALQAP